MKTLIKRRCAVLAVLMAAVAVVADDWPTHMHDNRRSGVSGENLDVARLKFMWVMDSPLPQKTAWAGPAPWDAYQGDGDIQDAMRNFDDAPFTTIVGNQVFIGSSVTDSAYALNRVTGAIQWVYTTDGPVRFPPVWHDNKVYFGSDDGYVYCLNAADGSLVWKYTPIPAADYRLIGNNGSLVPLWTVRTGVAIMDGKVYFASSLTSWETTWLCAVDAATGAEVYKVEGEKGDTPMGAIMVHGDNIYLLQGRSSPALRNRGTGAYLGRFGQDKLYGGNADCGAMALVTADGELISNFDNRGEYGVKGWDASTSLLATQTDANNIIADDGILYVLTDTTLAALGNGGSKTRWRIPSDTPFSLIKAGDVLIAGGNNKVVVYDCSDGSVIWQQRVMGRAAGLAVGRGTLVVGTDEGHVVGFAISDTVVSNEGGATGIGAASATLNGAVSSKALNSHHIRLCWGDEDSGETFAGWDHVEALGVAANGPLLHTINGLAANDIYYYRYAVRNRDSDGWIMAFPSKNFLTGELVLSTDFTELPEGTRTPATLTIQRPAGTTNEDLHVMLVVSGTAKAGSDYAELPGVVVIPAGATKVQVQVAHLEDLEDESMETIQVDLAPGNYMLGSSSSVVFSLIDNDALNPSEYSYQAEIGFPGYSGRTETLTNFPALVVFEEGRGGFSYSQCAPDGGDLCFSTVLRDSLLSYEIENWNPAGTSRVWVKLPTLAPAGTMVRAYWGHSSKPGVQSSSKEGGDNEFAGVGYLNERQPSSEAQSADWAWATGKALDDPAGFSAVLGLYVDTDADGMEDNWEISTFADMIAAGKTTDWDNDGFTDVNEFRAGTDPKDPESGVFSRHDGEDIANEELGITWYSRKSRINFTEEGSDPDAND